MFYQFGKLEEGPLHHFDPTCANEILNQAESLFEQFQQTPLEQVIDCLDRIGQLWCPGGRYFEQAKAQLAGEIPFSDEMTQATLALIPQILERSTLQARVASELRHLEILDRYCQLPASSYVGGVRAFGIGTLLHVTAGNVFLGALDSLVMGLLTKNISILKLAQSNQLFPFLFARSVLEADTASVIADKFAIVSWSRNDKEIESIFKQRVDRIIAWGGEEMLKSYRADLPISTQLLDYGPKISLQVICAPLPTEENQLDQLAHDIARDVALWDQSACASPQNLFFEEGIDYRTLMRKVVMALDAFEWPRGPVDADEQVEILKEYYRGKAYQFLENGHVESGKNSLAVYDPRPSLRTSPLHRTLIFKSFKNFDHLVAQLRPFKFYLQSCGYFTPVLAQKEELLARLGVLGMARFAQVGSVMEAGTGAPHDGKFALTQLVRFVCDETPQLNLINFVAQTQAHVPFYRELLNSATVTSLDQLPTITGAELARYPLTKGTQLLNTALATNGYIFSSGGTTGAPKYSFYTEAEFTQVGQMLGSAFIKMGLKPGSRVANLFAAGNMWSSFLAIDRALNFCQAVQLPIGMGEAAYVVEMLRQFRPTAIFGLPSLLVSYAAYAKDHQIDLSIPQVFYAGEHLYAGSRQFLRDLWQTQGFHSAGYASVDVGPIGYQCPHCTQQGEHHLFSQAVHLEIQGGEAVVTSRFRQSMPILRYRTGDAVEWSASSPCACGSIDPKFILLGRMDGQINIWSCKIGLAEIERAVGAAKIHFANQQIVVLSELDGTDELLEFHYESDMPISSGDEVTLRGELGRHLIDVAKTHPSDFLDRRLRFVHHSLGTIERVARTGKIRPVIDRRLV